DVLGAGLHDRDFGLGFGVLPEPHRLGGDAALRHFVGHLHPGHARARGERVDDRALNGGQRGAGTHATTTRGSCSSRENISRTARGTANVGKLDAGTSYSPTAPVLACCDRHRLISIRFAASL